MKKAMILVPMMVFYSVYSYAAEKVNLKDLEEKIKPVNAYELVASGQKGKPALLTRMKINELKKQEILCQRDFKLAIKLNPTLAPWLHLSVINCLNKAPLNSEKIAFFEKWLPDLEQKKFLKLGSGPWQKELWNRSLEMVKSLLLEKKAKEDIWLKWLDAHFEQMSREDQAWFYSLKADVVQRKKRKLNPSDLQEVKFFYQQSLKLSDNTEVRKKLEKWGDMKNEDSPLPPRNISLGKDPEMEWDENLPKDVIPAVASQMDYLRQYPNGRWVKKYRDKILEAYQHASGEDAEKILNMMSNANFFRLQDWAQYLHRRGDFKGALALVDRKRQELEGTPHANSLYWIAGRSALFIGNYDKAVFYFDQLIRFHQGTEESTEALFRLGLLQFRQRNYATAAVYFEKLLSLNTEKYELNSWYWLVRSLEFEKNERVVAEREALIQRYPFSYYGLKLRAESQQNKLQFAPAVVDEGMIQSQNVWWVGEQVQTWKRFLVLIEAGWLWEAQQELQSLPTPQDPWLMQDWGRFLAKCQLFPAAISVLSKALEMKTSLRHPDYIREIFPFVYQESIQKEAKKNSLDPFLVFSLIRQESAFYPRATSVSNALGLMQLIPPTAIEVAQRKRLKISLPEDLFLPDINVSLGTSYIAQMIDDFSGNIPMALAAYNAGPTRLKSWLTLRSETSTMSQEDEIWWDELPWSETSFYVKAILRNMIIYRLLQQNSLELRPVFWSEFYLKNTLTQ